MKESKIIATLDRIIEEFVEKEPIPGLAVGVVFKGEVIFAKGFGEKDINTHEPVTAHSLFHTASVSKTFTAMGIMQLEESGRLHLDKTINEYLSYFQMRDERYKDITIRQLLSHLSGMPDETAFEWENPQYDEAALERYVRSIKDRELLGNPGTSFAYSNVAFEILGDIIQKVSGMSFEDYMKKNILDKLQMGESHFLPSNLDTNLLTTPHVINVEGTYGPKVSEVFPYNRRHGPSSTLCSNVMEMCCYAITILNNGHYAGNDVLNRENFHRMFKKQGETNWGQYMEEVGLSWFLGEYKGHRLISHSGLDTGFRSNLMILPEKEIGLVLMTNSDYIGTQVIWKGILNVLLGEKVEYIENSLARYLAKMMINEGLKNAQQEYDKIRQSHFERYTVIEGELNYVAHELFENLKTDEAIGMLEIAIDIYPQASNLYDSLGEMHAYKGSKELALSYFNKAIELDPENKGVLENIEKIMSDD